MRAIFTLKRIVLAATALTLLAGAALAGSNEVYLLQNGTDNAGVVTQSSDDSRAGSATDKISQSGKSNRLSVTQTGRAALGVPGSGSPNTLGVDQKGGFNELTARQKNGQVEQVQQGWWQSHTASSLANELTIDQTDDFVSGSGFGSKVGRVTQNYVSDGDPGANRIVIDQAASSGAGANEIRNASQTGGGNSMTIKQRVGGNVVNNVDQNFARNSIDVSQDGKSNYIDAVAQSDGNLNKLTAKFSGDGNGVPNLRSASGSSGAGYSAFQQYGNRNTINLDVAGNNNAFGFWQNGSDNTVRPLAITGDGNAVGTFQQGNNNLIAVTAVIGSANDIGLRQVGIGNIVDGSTEGDSNRARIVQTGNDNVAAFTQAGAGNSLDATMTGNNNALDLEQNQPGAPGNRMTVDITGDNNNGFGSANFSGALQMAATIAGLSKGDVVQDGSNNRIDLSVIASYNAFALLQHGNSNSVTGKVTGDRNSAVVIQSGNGNSTSFTQTGTANSVLVVQ